MNNKYSGMENPDTMNQDGRILKTYVVVSGTKACVRVVIYLPKSSTTQSKIFDDQDAQLQNGAHANKLLGRTSISVAFSSRLSTIDISKEKAEVVSEPMGAFVGIFLGRYLEIYHGSIRPASQPSFFLIGEGSRFRPTESAPTSLT